MAETTYKFVNDYGDHYVLVIRNANIPAKMKNFSGAPTKFNPRGGYRTFCVVIDDHNFAEKLISDGWNVKQFRPKDESDTDPDYFISDVRVNFDPRYPMDIGIINDDGTIAPINEDSIALLDENYISYADLAIKPRHWEKDGKSGTSAWLSNLHVKIGRTVDVFAD